MQELGHGFRHGHRYAGCVGFRGGRRQGNYLMDSLGVAMNDEHEAYALAKV